MKTASVAAWAAVCFVGAVALPQTSGAQEQHRERGGIAFGAFITKPVTSARIDSNASSGTEIELEDDLGFETSTTILRVGGHLWIAPRQRLDFSYFESTREGSRAIDETIEFGDTIFDIHTVINSTSDATIVKADYTFAPIMKDRGYLGLTGGLYVAQTELSLSAPDAGMADSEDLTAPLPVIGLRGEYGISERITLRGAVQWFSIDAGDVDGSLRDSYVAADYSFRDRWSVGLAYNDVSMGINDTEEGLSRALEWGYDGFLIYMNWDFGERPR